MLPVSKRENQGDLGLEGLSGKSMIHQEWSLGPGQAFASVFVHSIFCVPSSLKQKDLEFWPSEEDDTYYKKESDYGSTIGCFLGLQSNDYHPPKTDLKTKPLCSKRDPFPEGQSKNDKQKDQKDDTWKQRGLDFFRAIPRFKRPSYHHAPLPPAMVFPPQQSAPSMPYSDTGMDTKHKSLTPMTSETLCFKGLLLCYV